MQGAGILEHLGVEFERGVRRVHPGTAAFALFGATVVRRAVGTEKKAGLASGRCLDERFAIRLRLQHRQAIEMRP